MDIKENCTAEKITYAFNPDTQNYDLMFYCKTCNKPHTIIVTSPAMTDLVHDLFEV